MDSGKFNLESFILAGGLSKRFGTDKARYKHLGRPFLNHIHDTVAIVSAKVTVIAKEAGAYDDLGVVTIADNYPEQAPIAGLLTAFDVSEMDWIFIISCDVPHIDVDILRSLWEQRQVPGVVPVTEGISQPLAALYHRTTEDLFRQAYREGQYSLHRIIKSAGFKRIDFGDHTALTNYNHPPEK